MYGRKSMEIKPISFQVAVIYIPHILCGDTWKNGRAMGLKAKFTEITNKCQSTDDVSFVDLNEFDFVGDIECIDENECRNFHRLLNVVFKRYYINLFGGPALANCPIGDIKKMFEIILQQMRKPVFDIVKLMDIIDSKFNNPSNNVPGQVYIIDNIKTTKVGASHDAQKRFRNLKNNVDIYPDARLACVYDVEDMYGFEAKAHALLNQWKTQNPLHANKRTAGWRNARRALFVFTNFG